VIIQLDTLDGVMRMWAWRDGEQPTEDVAPLIEEDFDLPNASPYIWTVSFEGPSSALFSWIAISTEHMPVNDLVYVPVPLGDVNGDGVVNGLDVDPFVDVLLNGPYQAEADMNDDGDVNGLDVDPFVAAVVGGGVAAVPEPATWGLALLAAVALACWQRRERC
jgi:hypothetical protein